MPNVLARFTDQEDEVSKVPPCRLLPEAFVRKHKGVPVEETGISVACVDGCSTNQDKFSLGADMVKSMGNNICALGELKYNAIVSIKYDENNNLQCIEAGHHKCHFEIRLPTASDALSDKIINNREIQRTEHITRELSRNSEPVIWKNK